MYAAEIVMLLIWKNRFEGSTFPSICTLSLHIFRRITVYYDFIFYIYYILYIYLFIFTQSPASGSKTKLCFYIIVIFFRRTTIYKPIMANNRLKLVVSLSYLDMFLSCSCWFDSNNFALSRIIEYPSVCLTRLLMFYMFVCFCMQHVELMGGLELHVMHQDNL
jgi:hypothetical protein